jgi:hypothetical protein
MNRSRRIGWSRWILVLAVLLVSPAWASQKVEVSAVEEILLAQEAYTPVPGSSAAKLLRIEIPNLIRLRIEVIGNRVVAEIIVLGVGADFSLTFDQPQNLSIASLGLGVQLVNPLDPALRARMPDSASNLAVALPLMIKVEPPAARGLAFSNVVELELHTHLLPFSPSSPLRLYKASAGGQFYDITNDIQSGSVRVRGRTGGFSDFLIVVDLNPISESAEDKFAFLDESVLAVPDAPLRALLQTDLETARTAYDGDDFAAARVATEQFETRVRANAGTLIPNRWRAQRDLDNVAGDLLTEAGSLRYALIRLGG